MMRTLLTRLGMIAVLAGLAACSDAGLAPSAGTGHEIAAAGAGSVIEVRDAFIVQPAAGRDMTGAGLSVTVTGAPQTLVAAKTDVAGAVELHTMAMDDGMMRMRKVENFAVSEAEPLKLERGGNHLMVFGLDAPLEIGETVDFVLTFESLDGTRQDIVTTAEIVPASG